MEMSKIDNLINKAMEYGFRIDTISIDKPNSRPEIFGKNSSVNVHSIAKTITSIGLGIFLSENQQISLEDKVLDYSPEYKEFASIGTEKITIKNLLHMQSGKHIQSLLQKNDNELWNSDWLLWFFEYPMNENPGEKYFYSSHCCYVIGRLIEKISKKDVNEYLNEKLWSKLKIPIPQWDLCPSGYTNCAGNLWINCDDLSKIGRLILNQGIIGENNIFKNNYIYTMLNDLVGSCDPFDWDDLECKSGYGYFIWKCSIPNVYRLWGAGGNFCVIDFSRHQCITVTSKRDDINWRKNNDNDLLRLIFDILIKEK